MRKKPAPPRLTFPWAAEFQARLLAWFATEGRDYPWRQTHDPYAILVSEVMLQQTQIATVLGRGYYQRWMTAFPDAAALAAAPEPEVLRVWEGLGYYSRARNLKKTARAVLEKHGGTFPRQIPDLLELPGVGRYTAGAMASFAWNLPAPLVDGNVARVFARLLAWDEPIDRPQARKTLWEWAEALLSQSEPRLYNSALMELGQRICTPRAPDCLECPVHQVCGSAGPAALTRPRKSPPRPVVQVVEHVIMAQQDGAILLHQEKGQRRQGLWKLPERSSVEVANLLHLTTTRYAITHHRVTLHVHAAPLAIPRMDEKWHPLADLPRLPMPGPFRKVLDSLLDLPEEILGVQ